MPRSEQLCSLLPSCSAGPQRRQRPPGLFPRDRLLDGCQRELSGLHRRPSPLRVLLRGQRELFRGRHRQEGQRQSCCHPAVVLHSDSPCQASPPPAPPATPPRTSALPLPRPQTRTSTPLGRGPRSRRPARRSSSAPRTEASRTGRGGAGARVSVTDLWTGDTTFIDGAVGSINASVAVHDSAVFRVRVSAARPTTTTLDVLRHM